MADHITVTAADGFSLAAYEAKPDAPARGGMIILQEIFGVNTHIREVCDRYALAGWHVLAPSLFDRSAAGVELAYNADGIADGRGHKENVDAFAEGDILACLKQFPQGMKTAIIGYCWGGSLAWRMACRHDGIDAAVAYYGGELPGLKDEVPRCKVQAHFGAEDASIPMEGVDAFMAAQPAVESYIYAAGHGFNCDHRPQYDAAASSEAQHRVDDFLSKI